LSGKVTYNGEAVTGGRIVLRPRGGPANGADDIRADVKPDGTFSVHGVGAGEFAVGVDTECLKPDSSPGSPRPGGRKPAGAKGAPPAEGPPAGTYVPLPDKFRYPASSGVTWDVGKEGLKKDISLVD
jgi:hypothetical protein